MTVARRTTVANNAYAHPNAHTYHGCEMTRQHWIAVASRDHVLRGVAGGFAQVGHGRGAPLLRMQPGDGIVYYAPAETMGGEPVRRFVAIGRIRDDRVYQADMSAMVGKPFQPFRRDVDWLDANEAAIAPLLDDLGFIGDKRRWGYPFRRGSFAVDEADFRRIAVAMGVAW